MKTITKILTWIFAILAIAMMVFTIVSVNTFDQADRSLFGYKAFIVLSDSMSATDFSAGDLALVKEVDPSTLQEGDIITYQSTADENYGEIVTHKIRSLTTDENGNPGFITYGTTTDTDDPKVVTYSDVVGQYQFALPKVGTFFNFLKTVPGYIVCILVPFLILIIMQGANTVYLFRKYKRQEMKEIQHERRQLEEERKKSQQMMEELLELKRQMNTNENAERKTTQVQQE